MDFMMLFLGVDDVVRFVFYIKQVRNFSGEPGMVEELT